LVAGAVVLTGCGAGGNGGAAPTVTVTQQSTTPSASTSATPTATSDVKGRGYDLGSVASVSKVGDVTVVELDRWTLPGTSDSTIARKGLPITPHKGARYTNQNTAKTYSAPLADGASVVVNTCVKSGKQLGLTSTPEPAASWLDKGDHTTVLIVQYDAQGRITRMDTDPRC